MDLEENIRIAAREFSRKITNGSYYQDLEIGFKSGALSNEARDYWYNEFKLGDGISNQINNVPSCKMSDLPCDLSYLIDGTYEKYERYLIDNPDRPISFDNWKYMVEHYEKPELISKEDIIGHVDHGPQIIHLHARNVGKNLMSSIEKIPFEIGGLGQEYHKGVIAIVPDEKSMKYVEEITKRIAADSSIHRIIVVTKEHYNAQGKDSILKTRAIGVTELPNIQSIVPIADVIPEPIISKQEFLKMHDKAVERSIAEEKFKNSHAWNTKKEKKVSHKRTNKRK